MDNSFPPGLGLGGFELDGIGKGEENLHGMCLSSIERTT